MRPIMRRRAANKSLAQGALLPRCGVPGRLKCSQALRNTVRPPRNPLEPNMHTHRDEIFLGVFTFAVSVAAAAILLMVLVGGL